MRIGTLRLTARIFLLATCALATANSYGQAPGTPGGAVQALFTSPVQGMLGQRNSNYVDAYGNPVVVPAGYGAPCECGGYGAPGYCGPEPCYSGGPMGHGPIAGNGFVGPTPMGAGGTDPPIGYDMMGDVGTEGYLVDQRGPHYFDIRFEAVMLERDETFGRTVDFTAEDVNGPVVLSSDQLEYDEEVGFRAIGRYDIGPLSVIEFGYMGIYSYESSASYTDPDPTSPDLFSLFSRPNPGVGGFGTTPAAVALPGGPMPESERALQHSISIESDLQTAEISYRRYWVGYSPRVSGTLLAGFRYTRLSEDFLFSSIGGDPPPGEFEVGLDYDIDAENNLAGFQTGADVWVGLMQGLRLGGEAKAGIYNNHYRLENRIITTPLDTFPPTTFERFVDNKPALIAEGSIDLVADILPSWSIRAGYEVLFMNSLVLAGDNFNEVSPYDNQGVFRVPFVDDEGEAFYHGGHAGLEFIW